MNHRDANGGVYGDKRVGKRGLEVMGRLVEWGVGRVGKDREYMPIMKKLTRSCEMEEV